MALHKKASIIIAGCGPFGAAMARTIYKKGYKVVVLDQDRDNFRYLPEEYGGYEMEGDPTDPRVLKEAGIGEAGIVMASTQDDNANLLIAQIASRIYHVEHVYARLEDPSRNHLIMDLPIEPICPIHLTADEYLDLAESVCRGVAV